MPTLTRRQTLTALGISAIAAPTAGALTAQSATAAEGDQRHRVVLIDIDGFDPRLLDGAYADIHPLPRIRQLRREGAWGVASGTFASYSNSSRTSTATGTWPAVHRNTGYYLTAEGATVTQERYIEPGVETIAHALRRQNRTGAYVQWYAVQNYGASYGDPQQLYTQPGGTISDRVDDAVALLSGEPVFSGGQQVTVPQVPDFLAVYSSEVDGYLHSNGFARAGLADALEETDTQVGRLLDTITDLGLADTTTVILTSDHGLREWTQPLLPELQSVLESTGASVSYVSAGGTADPEAEIVVYCAPRTADITVRAAFGRGELTRLARRIERIHGVAKVYDERELGRMGASDKHGDLVVEPIEPFHFSTLQDGVRRASHGGLEEAEVPLIIAGAGVRRGSRLRRPSLLDIAPTICQILDVGPPSSAHGRHLREAFLR
ncbi:alkaline phosphatase family protein [Ruania halotolerans]|uniref:alkaline phosphatase family protein n=1 Tax=Ruania halotolerans TaxID=2897773 RepID=UPI001E622951|nr:alkaline phosphatase family protein [Ruania halotolerans]UFU07968.1 alkaline phosphatase family protein [Ruania halotolerans]